MIYEYEMINGNVVVNQHEAEIIRQIFKNYISGMSYDMSAKMAGASFKHSSVKRMLMKKCYAGDFFTLQLLIEKLFLRHMTALRQLHVLEIQGESPLSSTQNS